VGRGNLTMYRSTPTSQSLCGSPFILELLAFLLAFNDTLLASVPLPLHSYADKQGSGLLADYSVVKKKAFFFSLSEDRMFLFCLATLLETSKQ
ncbi:hypothetical protein, partial [Enterococcus faecalis]